MIEHHLFISKLCAKPYDGKTQLSTMVIRFYDLDKMRCALMRVSYFQSSDCKNNMSIAMLETVQGAVRKCLKMVRLFPNNF